jgi:hypothetical protein
MTFVPISPTPFSDFSSSSKSLKFLGTITVSPDGVFCIVVVVVVVSWAGGIIKVRHDVRDFWEGGWDVARRVLPSKKNSQAHPCMVAAVTGSS